MVNIYIENDFASELKNDSATNQDHYLNEPQIRAAILQVAEIWNLANEAVTLNYIGAGDYENVSDFCDDVPDEPNSVSLYIHYRSGMDTLAGHSATTRDIPGSGCGKKRQIAFFELDQNGNPIDWRIGSQATTGNFGNALTHEFGHVLGLGHTSASNDCRSVMAGCSTGPFQDWGGRYPLAWDKSCPAVVVPKRKLRNKYAGFKSNGDFYSVGSNSTHRKGMISSGHSRTTSNSSWASLWLGRDSNETAYLGADGYIPFVAGTVSSVHRATMDGPYMRPVVHSFRSISGDGVRISFVDDINDANGSTQYNPPVVQFIRTTPSMNGALIATDRSYRRCLNVSCSSSESIVSHLPIVSAYDPVTGNDIGVQVVTNSLDGQDGNGQIRVFAGLNGTSNRTFEQGETMPNNFPTSPVPFYSYGGRTHLIPSVACGDINFGLYNCIIAWIDKGVQRQRVLYWYFRVNSSGNDVIWSPAGAVERGGTSTYTSPAVAFFGNRMHLAWRSFNNIINVYNTTSSSNYSWSFKKSFTSSTGMVGPPSFIHKSGSEAVLIYDENQY